MHAVARNWREAPLSETDRALCEHAAKLTHDQHSSSVEDLDALRAHGFNDNSSTLLATVVSAELNCRY